MNWQNLFKLKTHFAWIVPWKISILISDYFSSFLKSNWTNLILVKDNIKWNRLISAKIGFPTLNPDS